MVMQERKQGMGYKRTLLHLQRRTCEELLNLAPPGYLVTDGEGVIDEASGAAAQMLNGERRYLVGKPLVVFVLREEL